jgi:hypothetical protein
MNLLSVKNVRGFSAANARKLGRGLKRNVQVAVVKILGRESSTGLQKTNYLSSNSSVLKTKVAERYSTTTMLPSIKNAKV